MTEHQKRIILFVDDDEDDFFLLKDIFKECSDTVELIWVKDGEEALNRLTAANDALKPALILLDLNMPKLNGRDVLSLIKNRHELRGIPVVVLTNSMNKDEAKEAYRLGVNSFIRKPSGYKELQEFVETLYKYWFKYSTLN